MQLILHLIAFCFAQDDWFQEFHTNDEIRSWFESVEADNLSRVSLITNEQFENLYAIQISSATNEKRVVFIIDCGKYGSDWLAIVSCQYITAELLKEDNLYDYIIIPVMNPSGYDYTWTDDRTWQKNRQSLEGTLCDGVFINSNYDYEFSNVGVNPCSNVFPGFQAFSEQESEFHEMILTLTATSYPDASYVSLSIQGWGGYANVPFNIYDDENGQHYKEVATKMALAATNSGFGAEYKSSLSDVISGSSVAYIFDTVTDWTFEFKPRGTNAIANTNEIIPAGSEAFNALKALEFEFAECNSKNDVLIGFGKADITGPVTMVNMMGFVTPAQTATGFHGRMYARAMYVRNCDGSPFVYVSLDNGMGSWAVKRGVLQKLAKGGVNLNSAQVIISGTHTHSGNAGYFDYFVFEITSSGFIKDSTDAIIDGVYQAILEARLDVTEKQGGTRKPRKMLITSGQLFGASINRSPASYDKNDQELLDYYTEGNTDKNMTVLYITDDSDEPVALFNWFAVHPVAMNKTNTLINGDVKGWASDILETEFKGTYDKFIAAFCSTNLGDVSPNIDGARCHYNGDDVPSNGHEGQMCDYERSTCPTEVEAGQMVPGQSNQYCYTLGVGTGPKFVNNLPVTELEHDMKDSTDMITKLQSDKVRELLNDEMVPLGTQISYRHKFVHMPSWTGIDEKGNEVRTCKAALGVAMAAGCTDGHGAKFFDQGTNMDYVNEHLGGEDWIWFKIRELLAYVLSDKPVDPEEYKCHQAKPVLIPSGWADKPYAWHPETIELGVYRIGELFILTVPGEFTTMAGRKLREGVRQEIRNHVEFDPTVIIAGLSNIYTHYITTEKEYDAQRYEAGSTIYGRSTLLAYTTELKMLAKAVINDESINEGVPGPDLSSVQIECLTQPGIDLPLNGSIPIGTVLSQPISQIVDHEKNRSQYEVSAIFVGANPRNILHQESLLPISEHFAVEICEGADLCNNIGYSDKEWETEMHWSYQEAAGSNWFKFDKTKTAKEFDMYGPLAGVAYATGLITGRQLDFETAIYNIQNGLSTNWDDISRPVDPIENCAQEGSGPLDATSIIELKLILNWQRPIKYGTYRFKYNAFIRDAGGFVEVKTFYSDIFTVT